jgi:Kef-type K+ transport system membrane component KefB
VLLGIVAVVVVSPAAFPVARRLRRAAATRLIRARSRRSPWALDPRMSLIIPFVPAAIAVQQNTGVQIAGFSAGAVPAMPGEPRRPTEQLIGLAEGFPVPLFFVTLGAKLQLSRCSPNCATWSWERSSRWAQPRCTSSPRGPSGCRSAPVCW